MSLKSIFCQDRALDVLVRAFMSGRVPHAYIFSGPPGVGKFTTALEWGKLLLCERPVVQSKSADSCGECESCVKFEAGSHHDFDHVYKELLEFTVGNKDKTAPLEFAIDVVREFILDKAGSKPVLSKKRVFIVSEAEKLNINSQNCLLKVLEEPPVYCSIILLSTSLERLLATVKSRSQIIRFGPIDEVKIIEQLEGMGLAKEQARYFSRLSEGSLGTAKQYARLELSDCGLYQRKREIVEMVVCGEYDQSLETAGKFLRHTGDIANSWEKLEEQTSKKHIRRSSVKTVIAITASALADAMKLKVSSEGELVNADQAKAVKRLASRLDAETAAEKIETCYRIMESFDSNVNERLGFEQLLLSLADFGTMKV